MASFLVPSSWPQEPITRTMAGLKVVLLCLSLAYWFVIGNIGECLVSQLVVFPYCFGQSGGGAEWLMERSPGTRHVIVSHPHQPSLFISASQPAQPTQIYYYICSLIINIGFFMRFLSMSTRGIMKKKLFMYVHHAVSRAYYLFV